MKVWWLIQSCGNNFATINTVEYIHWSDCFFKRSWSAWWQCSCFQWIWTLHILEFSPLWAALSSHHLQDLWYYLTQGFSHIYTSNSSHLRASSVTWVTGSSYLGSQKDSSGNDSVGEAVLTPASFGQHRLVCIQFLVNIRLDVRSRRPLRDPS